MIGRLPTGATMAAGSLGSRYFRPSERSSIIVSLNNALGPTYENLINRKSTAFSTAC